MKYFLIAGEKSGDQHAGRLVSSIRKLDAQAEIIAWGGASLESAGAKVTQRYEEMAFMGLDFLFSLVKILGLFKKCKNEISDFQPDVLILVDYGGFNLRIAKWAFTQKIETQYFIPPKTWAWNESRNEKIKKFISKAYVILPFEEGYLQSKGVDATYVGNPTKEAIDALNLEEKKREGVAFLPGSRVGEIKRIGPLLVRIANAFPLKQFTVAALKEIPAIHYNELNGVSNVKLEWDKTYEILQKSEAAVVTSGTATLETALFSTPQVVVYKAAPLFYAIGKLLVKVKFISLVNLISNKEVVKEFIQDNYDFCELEKELKLLLNDTNFRENQLIAYQEIKEKLTDKIASNEAAKLIYQKLRKENED
ncbi:lipid-A-disaccharide synthase [Spirosomataceae bacterium TFI 002]|nr:lipid-A-disaccharide synthase [Spirosomataceae bacterium TFI 002]